MIENRVSLPHSLVLRFAAAGRIAILFAFHAIVFAICLGFSYLLRFEFDIPHEHQVSLLQSLPMVVGVQLLIGALFGFYRSWWRYVGIGDVFRLVFGLTAALAVLLGLWYLDDFAGDAFRFVTAPRGVLLIDWGFALLGLFGSRILVRVGNDRFRAGEGAAESRNVVIIGAGDAGESLAREIQHRPQLGMKVAAFVDDQRRKWGSHIRGIEVRGPLSSIGQIADEVGADEALIAIPSAAGKRVREIIHYLAAADLKFKTIPGIDHLVSGRVHVSQLRPVNVEDLLRRKRIDLPGDPVREIFRNKRVLVTGAGGTIGAELASQVAHLDPEQLTLFERSEYALYECRKRLLRELPWAPFTIHNRVADIRDTDAVASIIAEMKPHIILHAAAHKHVPLGEENPAEYLLNNTLATRRLAEVAGSHGVERLVLISSDKAINPSSVMGATKRAAEIVLLDLSRQSKMLITCVRFGNVIGSSGSVIPLFMEQIAAGGPVTVTHPEVTRYFIRTSEAVSLVLQAATLGNCGQVFMLDMGEPIRIADLAHDLIQLSNQSDEIQVVFTGLRPGEKLFEEISLTGEACQPTVHPQIVITTPPQPDSAVVQRWIQHIENARLRSPDAVIEALRRLVPEYSPARASQTMTTAVDHAPPMASPSVTAV